MKRVLVMIFLLLCFVTGVVMLEAFPVSTFTHEFLGSALRVTISERRHFFAEDFTIEFRASQMGAEIFYTLDGSVPTVSSLRYDTPLEFEVSENVEAVVLRAIAIVGDEISAPFTHTIFYGTGVEERFDTLVFSLSTDDENLYDHYLGIFVEGAVREEYLRENPGASINAFTPANFNQRGRDFERPVYMEVFNPNGRRAFTQAAGMRVTGAGARDETIKSVRLIARREYSPGLGSFQYRFFPGDRTQDARGRNINAYDTIILRNGGADRNHGVLRHELGSVLARRAGLDVTPVRAAALFINGNYYGYMWLQTRIDDDYLRALYNSRTRNFDVVGRGELEFRDATPEQEQALSIKNFFAFRDLTNDADFAQLEAIVDIENLLRYYAFQIWVGNNEWPDDNLYRWRYTGEPDIGRAPELDGRWRYAMFGLDQTFGHIGGDYTRPTLHNLLSPDNFDGGLLRNILTRDDMAELFVNIFHELMEEVLNYETVREILDELSGDITNEVGFAIEAGLLDESVSHTTISEHLQSTLHFAQNRHIYILESLEEFFD